MAAALAERLRRHDALTALIVKMPAPAQVEAAGSAGFDLVVVDTEHGPAGGLELEHHLRAASAAGLPALVRVPSASPDHVLAALDAGAAGVVVPHVVDAAGAAAAVAAAHYPPRGRRGFALSTRAGRYGAVATAEHLRAAAAETVVVVQIEDAEAIGQAAEILAVEGVSAVLVGTADLSLSLGRPGDTAHPDVATAVDAVLAAAARRRVPLVAVAASATEADAWRARGASVVAWVATGLVQEGFRRAAGRTHAADGGPGPRQPLVLLPGMLGDADLWDDVALLLAADAAPQVGRIDRDDSVPELAASVLAAAPPRFALAGHSLGAIVALEIQRQAPGRVTRLALLNASGRAASAPQLEAWSALRGRVAAGAFAEVARDHAHDNLPAARRDDRTLLDRVEAMALRVGGDGLLRQLAAQETRPDSVPRLGGVGVPTLVVSGDDDDVCPPELQEELAAGIPHAGLASVAACGHLAPLERPEAVAGLLERWLRA